LDDRLKLGTEGYSPAMLQKIEYASGNEPSFSQASRALAHLAEVSISPKHLQRLAGRLGEERRQYRDAEVAAHQAKTLQPRHTEPPVVAAVHLDAGKIQMRDDDGPAGVREPHWADTKVACCVTYTPRTGTQDPQPDPPPAFLDRPSVMRLCREMNKVRNAPPTVAEAAQARSSKSGSADEKDIERPERLVRTAVATMQPAEPFGAMAAAEAMRRGFYRAAKQAVLGDGAAWIWNLADQFFPDWVQTLDFLHLLTYLYAAAVNAHRGQANRAWRLYVRLVRAAWSGQAAKVIGLLTAERKRLGDAPQGAPPDDPRCVVAQVLEYVTRNERRMDYAFNRREGLPCTSAPVESLIKQFNQRVKGSEKFWTSHGAEAILQIRAAYLSDDDRAAAHHDRRPRGRAVGANRLRWAA